MKKEFLIACAAALGLYALLVCIRFVDAGRWQNGAGLLGFYMGPVLIIVGLLAVLFPKLRLYGAGLLCAGLVILLLGYYFCSIPAYNRPPQPVGYVSPVVSS